MNAFKTKITENGTTPIKTEVLSDAGKMAIYAVGEFGGASIQLQYKIDGQLYDYDGGAITANRQLTLNQGAGVIPYLTVTGATASTSVDVMAGMTS